MRNHSNDFLKKIQKKVLAWLRIVRVFSRLMNASLLSIHSRALRIEMIKRGLSRHDLAAMTGLNAGTISNMMSGLQAGRNSIAAIEKALNIHIYTQQDQAQKNRKLEKFLGVNPVLETTHALRRLAAQHNLPGRATLRKAELIRLLQFHLLPAASKRNRASHAANKKRQR